MTLPILMLQVTLWLLLGACLYLWSLRQGPQAAARCLSLVLGGVVLLSAVALLPMPGWPLHNTLTWFAPGDSLHAQQLPQATVRIENAPVEETGATAFSFKLSSLFPRQISRTTAAEPAPMTTAFSWGDSVVLTLLLACGCFGFVRLLLGLWAVRECRRRSVPVIDEGLHILCDTLRHEMSIAQHVELRTLAGLGSPATIGWRKPVLLLPENWTVWSEEERRSVFAHELAHVQAGDYARWLLAQLGTVLHGYQPLVHWLLARLHREQELAADLLAARHVGGTGVYLRSLCRLALAQQDGSQPFPARTLLPVRFPLIRRITMLRSWKNDGGTIPSRLRRYCGLALLLLLGVSVAGLRSTGWAQEKQKSQLGSTLTPGQENQVRHTPFVLNYVHPDMMGVVAIRPALAMAQMDNLAIRDKANLAMKRFIQMFSGKDSPTCNLDMIEQVVLEYQMVPKNAGKPGYEDINLNLVRLREPEKWQPLLEGHLAKLEQVRHGKGSYYRLPLETRRLIVPFAPRKETCLFMPDERTLVLANESQIRGWLTGGTPQTPAFPWAKELATADASNPFMVLALDGPRYLKAMEPLSEEISKKGKSTCELLTQAQSLVFFCTANRQVTVHVTAAGEHLSGAVMGQAALEQAKYFIPIFTPQAAKDDENKELSVVVDLEKNAVRLQMMPKADSARPTPQPQKEVVPAGAIAIGHNMVDRFKRFTFQHETSLTLSMFLGSFHPAFSDEAAPTPQPDQEFQAQVYLLEVPVAVLAEYRQKHMANVPVKPSNEAYILTEAHAKALLEMAQADKRMVMLSAPKLQTLPGQVAIIKIGDRKGWPESDKDGKVINPPDWECKITMKDAPNGPGILLDAQSTFNDDGKSLRPVTPENQGKLKYPHVAAWSCGAAQVVPSGHSMLLVATSLEQKAQPNETTILLLVTPSAVSRDAQPPRDLAAPAKK